MLNVWTGQGRLVKEPELRYTQQQTAVLSFSIACERDFAGQDGKRPTDFLDCVAWKNTAEFISKWFGKGDMIVLSGTLQKREWTDNNGNKRYSTEIVVSSANFAGGKNSGTGNTGSQPAAQTAAPSGFYEIPPDEDDGELPF